MAVFDKFPAATVTDDVQMKAGNIMHVVLVPTIENCSTAAWSCEQVGSTTCTDKHACHEVLHDVLVCDPVTVVAS